MEFLFGITLKVVSMFTLIFGIYGLQQFTEKPQDLDIIKGQTAVMRCAVENRVGNIQWGKGTTSVVLLGYDRKIPGYGSRYSIIGNNPTEHNLQIVNVGLDDDDGFQCQVGPVDNNPALLAKAYLKVLVPPNMPAITDYINGSVVDVVYTQPTFKLICTSTNGRPAATLKWLRNGVEITDRVEYITEPIPNDKRENARNTLTLSPKYPDDNGVYYTCEADSVALMNGPLKTVVLLSVLYPPGQPFINGYKVNQVIRVGDTINLICTSEGGNPLAQVIWFRNSLQLDFSYTQRDNKAENELIITAERSDNDAQYRCEAWNRVNADTPLTVMRTLIVHFAPKSATISGKREAKAGETLTLTCMTTNSNPAAVITWIPSSGAMSRSRIESSQEGGFITISEIDITLTNQQTNAIYTCSAANYEVGVTVADTVTVGVMYPPEAPQITGYSDGEPVRAGSLLTMRCTALKGNPPATLKWFKGDQEVTDVTDMTASNIPAKEINIVTKAHDNGNIYRCEASNKATETPLVVLRKLTVYFPPASVNITSDPAVGRAGKQLRLTCITASSNPAAEITWIQSTRHLLGLNLEMTNAVNGGKSSKNVLEFLPSSADHGLAYSCRATNLALQETINDAVTLTILYKPEFVNKDTVVSIKVGESRMINLSARANPDNSNYTLRHGEVVINAEHRTLTLDTKGVLTITAIAKEHAGLYTIAAMNSEGQTSFDFRIDVQYPAEILQAVSVVADVGSSTKLKCVVSGNPMTSNMVTWKRDNFDMTRTLSSYENGVGSLVIDSVTKTDSGKFKCVADNGVGMPVEKEVQLTIQFTPAIDKSQEYLKAASQMGHSGHLICNAEGAPTVSFQWKKDGVNIQANAVKYEIQEKVSGVINYQNVLLIKGVQKSDYGIYQCVVTNPKGEDTLNVKFDDTTKPDPPYDIEVVNKTHNSITIKWKPGFDGGVTQAFRVRYKELDTAAGFVQVDVLPKDSTVFIIRGLSLGTNYEITVMAYNDLGGSDYQPSAIIEKTSNLKPAPDVQGEAKPTDDKPVIIILVVCIVGIVLLALNIGLILLCVRRRRKRMENGSDTASNTNTIELYRPTKVTQYPMAHLDDTRSYEKGRDDDDNFSDEFKSYEDEDIKRVFLPPQEYGRVTYSHNNLDSPTFDHVQPVQSECRYHYNEDDTDSCRKSPWQYEDPYWSNRGKGTFETDYQGYTGDQYEQYSRAGDGRLEPRPKSVMTESSELSSQLSSRGGYFKTPPPPPIRTSSKGAADIPPLPARNYGSQEHIPRYAPFPGSSTLNSNINIIPNPSYDGPSIRTPLPRPLDPTDDMRGYLV